MYAHVCIYEINLTTLLFTTQATISLPSLVLSRFLFIYSFVVVIVTAAAIVGRCGMPLYA